MTERKNGTIVYWSGIFGFIQVSASLSVFFHKSQVRDGQLDRIHLLDRVSFVLSRLSSGKHKGEWVAKSVQVEQRYDLNDFSTYIGKLEQWDGRKGVIHSRQLDEGVLFYKTRSFNLTDEFMRGEYLVFHPVISSKNVNQLFALFAYPLRTEVNIEFLQKAFMDTGVHEVKSRLDELATSLNLGWMQIFELQLKALGPVEDDEVFKGLQTILRDFDKCMLSSVFPSLQKVCADKYLMLLWELEVIDDVDLDLMKVFFHYSLSAKKRDILKRLSDFERAEVINYHFDALRSEGKLRSLNNSIKTLLDIVYRNAHTKDAHIFGKVKQLVLSNFEASEIFELWLHGYLDQIPEHIVFENFDLNKPGYVEKLVEKRSVSVKRLLEGEIREVDRFNFTERFSDLVIRLKIYQEHYASFFSDLLGNLCERLGSQQRLCLWLFEVPVKISPIEFYRDFGDELNAYFKLRFHLIMSGAQSTPEDHEWVDTTPLTTNSLLGYVSTCPWNDLIQPSPVADAKYAVSFLADIENYNERFPSNEIDNKSLATTIFLSLEKYQVEHLRLWLYGYVGSEYFDYFGFRSCFAELAKEEQALFKEMGDKVLYEDAVGSEEEMKVLACKEILSTSDSSTVYRARVENLYFSSGEFKLRLKNGSFTQPYENSFASSGFNRISPSHPLNKIDLKIEVSNETTIIACHGFDQLVSQIYSSEIDRVLGVVAEPLTESSTKARLAYMEDWRLRKKIIDYLKSQQCSEFTEKTVYEPRNFYRRLDDNSPPDHRELNTIFSLRLEDSYALIWENIDLSEGRATFVFKATKETAAQQINKLVKLVGGSSQLRSTLVRQVDTEEKSIFIRECGFLGRVKRSRGKQTAFEEWKKRLEYLLQQPTPKLPTSEELDKINDWSPQTSNHASPRLAIKKINRSGLKTMDLDFGSKHSKGSGKTIPDQQKMKRILSALRLLNDHLTENLTV